MQKNLESQKGVSLASVMIVVVVLGIFAYGLMNLTLFEGRSRAQSRMNLNVQEALDSGLDMATNVLNQGNNWASPEGLDGFMSVTSSPHSAGNTYQIYVKILAGKRVDSGGFGSTSDTALSLWTNQGDPTYDRTVVVRAKHIGTFEESKAVGILHRNSLITVPEIGGIYGTTVNNGGWSGTSYNSCSGPAGAGNQGCDGTVEAGSGGLSSSGNFCIPQTSDPTLPPYPTPQIPPNTVPLPGNTLVTQDWSASNGVVLGPGPINYQCGNFSLGNNNISINTNGGMVQIFVTGSFDGHGNGQILSPGYEPGGNPANAWFYVSGNSTLSGTGTYEIVLVDPTGNVTMNGGGNGAFYGAVVANNFTKNGSGGSFHFDSCILQRYKVDNYRNPPIVTVSWKNIPL
jgi:hypothetical protein